MGRWFCTLSILFLVFFSGCNNKPPTGKECFQWATGLDLPEGVICRNVKVITVVFVGDTYYVELSSQIDLTSFLAEHFKSTDWDVAKRNMIPPDDWKKELPFWDETEIHGKEYYTRDYQDSSETSFVNVLSYDKTSGTIFFVGSQCRE